jgi:anhydro-N-acetylmuramic acid kinase
VAGVQSTPIARDTAALFESLCGPASGPASSLLSLRAELAKTLAPLVLDLLDSLGMASGRVLCVGVNDPGLWECRDDGPTGYLGVCDAARLAETTGLNVIDAFPARDLAAGGQGGPLGALPHWILLRDGLRNRVLLDLGRTTRLTYLPTARTQRAEAQILSFDIGPGAGLLDLLAERLTGGQHPFDPGGRLAVQGKRIAELIDHWMSNSYFDDPPPRWHPRGVLPERFLADALQMAVAADWSVRDVLCTATHFIAEMVARTLRSLPGGARIDEVIVTGGGQHNGMLLHEISRLTAPGLVRLDELGFPSDSLDPAAAAILAMLHLDQVPANPTSITKAATPRLLGRLTGGSPQSWQLLLETCAGGSSSLRPLRTAI